MTLIDTLSDAPSGVLQGVVMVTWANWHYYGAH